MKQHYSIPRTYVDFVFVSYNISILLAFGFLFHNFQLLSNQFSRLEKVNQELFEQNIQLRRLLEDKIALEVINPSVTPMSDEYKIFLIKLSIILVVLSLLGVGVYFWFYWFKVSVAGLFQKTAWGYLSSFLSYNKLEKITYVDKLNNSILIRFTDKSTSIDIKPYNCENFISLEEFFLKHPELFKEVLQSSTDIISSAAVHSSAVAPAVESMSQFIDKMF